jgi:hypothetical protein
VYECVRTCLRGEFLERDRVEPGHVDLLLVPSRAIVRVHAETRPNVLGEIVCLLLRKRLPDNDVSVRHEVIDIVGCDLRVNVVISEEI